MGKEPEEKERSWHGPAQLNELRTGAMERYKGGLREEEEEWNWGRTAADVQEGKMNGGWDSSTGLGQNRLGNEDRLGSAQAGTDIGTRTAGK